MKRVLLDTLGPPSARLPNLATSLVKEGKVYVLLHFCLIEPQ